MNNILGPTTRLALLVSTICLLKVSPCEAHPFHTTTAEMEFNSTTGRLEVSLKIPASDLPHMLRVGATIENSNPSTSGISSDAKTASGLNDQERILAKYLETHYFVAIAGKCSHLEWVGMEDEALNKWIYFELVLPEEQKGQLELTNKVLFEVNKDQFNTVVYVTGTKRVSVKTHENSPTQVLP